jgi:hypothetical protein
MSEVKDQSRLAELKSALATRVAAMDGTVDAVVIEDNGGVVVSQEKADYFRRNLAEAKDIRGEIAALEGYEEIKSWMDAPASRGFSGGSYVAPQEVKSLARQFTESPEFKELSGGASGLTMRSAFEAEIMDMGRAGYIERKDVYNGQGGSYSFAVEPGLAGVQFDGMVPRATRQTRVRDLFPAAPTSASLIDYFRVLGFGASRLNTTSGASVVADYSGGVFGLKPHSSLTFEVAQAPVRTIAHYEAAHRNVLMDVPQLEATINNELLYGLRLEEDHQILNGPGSGENLLGIMNTPNIQTHLRSSVAGDSYLDALRRSATKAMLAYYEPTGFVMHPYDWETVELTKGTTNDHYLLVTNAAIGAAQQVWSQPVVQTPAMNQGYWLTGAFGLGAQLYDRMQASIRVAEQHSDFFVRNAVVILAEERLALAVKRPEAFVKGTF